MIVNPTAGEAPRVVIGSFWLLLSEQAAGWRSRHSSSVPHTLRQEREEHNSKTQQNITTQHTTQLIAHTTYTAQQAGAATQ